MRAVPANGVSYVCNASRYMMPNLIPILDLGLDRIDTVIVLVGTDSPPSAGDLVHAVRPAARFARVVRQIAERQGIAAPAIEAIECRAGDYLGWRRRLGERFAAGGTGGTIVNVTAGTTAMTVCAIERALDRRRNGDGPWSVLAFAPAPRRMIFPLAGTELRLPVEGSYAPLDDYLLLHGYREVDRRERLARQEAAIGRARLTRQLFAAVASAAACDANIALDVLNRTFNPLADGRRFREGMPRVPAAATLAAVSQAGASVVAVLGAFLEHLMVVEHRLLAACADGLAVQSPAAARYLANGWLEELAYLDAMDAVGSRGTACLSLAFADEAEGRWATEGECDVAVYMRDQLHVIECKTGKYQRRTDHVKGVDRDTVKGAKDLKEKLVGPFGTCAIWNLRPVLPEHAGFVAQVAGEASKGRIPLWTGPDGRASAQALWARLVAETEPPSQD